MTSEEKHRVEQTYRSEKSRLLGFIRKRIPDETEAEDLLQDVFLRLVLSTTGIQTIENITAWLYSVTRNRIVDFFRKKKPGSLEDALINNASDQEAARLEDILPALGNSPEDEMMAEVIWEEINKSLETMPGEQSRVFIMHEFEDMSIKEISNKTGVNQNTVLARKRYAILFLRKRLQSLYNQINE